jgi:hypothetical protein
VILAFILPGKLLRESFAAQGSLAGLLVTLWMVLAHLYGNDFGIWSVRGFGKYLLILVGIVSASWVLLYFFKGLRMVIESIAERLSPLSTVYLALDLFGVIIIIVRNV